MLSRKHPVLPLFRHAVLEGFVNEHIQRLKHGGHDTRNHQRTGLDRCARNESQTSIDFRLRRPPALPSTFCNQSCTRVSSIQALCLAPDNNLFGKVYVLRKCFSFKHSIRWQFAAIAEAGTHHSKPVLAMNCAQDGDAPDSFLCNCTVCSYVKR